MVTTDMEKAEVLSDFFFFILFSLISQVPEPQYRDGGENEVLPIVREDKV